MLALTARLADGTITWMTGEKTIREHTVPRLSDAAAAAGRPAPRVVVGLPIAITRQVDNMPGFPGQPMIRTDIERKFRSNVRTMARRTSRRRHRRRRERRRRRARAAA
jgi:hypothetical protein